MHHLAALLGITFAVVLHAARAQTTPPACASDTVTYTFQRGSVINSDELPGVTYEGGNNAQLAQNSPNTAFFGGVFSLSDGGSGVRNQALFEWDGLGDFIPAGSYVESATIKLYGNDIGNTAYMYRLLVPFNSTSTWNTFVGGVDNDGVEATAASIATLVQATADVVHPRTVTVTDAVRHWISYGTSGGFAGVMIEQSGTDGRNWVGHSNSVASRRPQLTVTWRPDSRAYRHSFQQGVDDYSGTADTFMRSGSPTQQNSESTTLIVDGPGGSVTALLRFDDSVGGAGPVPAGLASTWVYASTLSVSSFESSGAVSLYRMATAWNESVTHATARLNGNTQDGIQFDGLEALSGSVGSFAATTASSTRTASVLSTAGWWMEGNENNGLYLYTTNINGDTMHSSESDTVSARPTLVVEWAQCGGACDDDSQLPATPTLNATGSGIAGDSLVLAFDVAGAGRYSLVGWTFPGATATTCDDPDGDQGELWALEKSFVCGTADRHTLTVPLTQALSGCGFSAEPVDGGDVWYYESVVEATTVENASAVFGDEQNRTTVTAFRVRVEFPKEVAVNGTASVFGAVIDQSALTEQTFDSVTQEFAWNLATSVQYPYYLEPVSTAVSGGHTFDTVPAVASGGDCSGDGTDAAPAACTQDFALSANETDDCFVPAGTTVTVTFQILCRPQYAGSCDLPEGNTTTASFSVETDDFCPQVVEVASITPSLTTYSDSDRTSVSTNYILETTLFARVTADVEAGLRAQRTTLTGLDIVSSCSTCTPLVQPFPDTSAALAAYGFQFVAGGTDNSATGEVETDFSFTLNTNSLSFDNDASTGEAQITLTAYVTVEYDTPSAQGLQRSYRVQAVSGPGSIGSSASANFGVSGSSAGTTGGSSSTAGSTVLGVSTGTAALAAVGLAAVAAVAAGAAVAAKRRRSSPSKATASSSSSSLELGAAAARAPAPSAAAPSVATTNLHTVRGAYEQTARV